MKNSLQKTQTNFLVNPTDYTYYLILLSNDKVGTVSTLISQMRVICSRSHSYMIKKLKSNIFQTSPCYTMLPLFNSLLMYLPNTGIFKVKRNIYRRETEKSWTVSLMILVSGIHFRQRSCSSYPVSMEKRQKTFSKDFVLLHL